MLAAAGMKVSAPAGMDISDAGSLSRSMQKQPQQQKANSTSSIYIQSTLVKPDTDEVVFCIAAVIHDRIQQGEAMPAADRHRFPFFSEDNNPLYAAPAESQGGTSDHESSSDSNQKRPRRQDTKRRYDLPYYPFCLRVRAHSRRMPHRFARVH